MADINVKIKVKDDGSKVVKKFAKTTDKSFTKIATSSKKMGTSFTKSAIKLGALVGGMAALSKVAKSFLTVARMTENFKVRLSVLLGSVAEGNKLFKSMADYAGKVPYEYQNIMESATMLAGVLKGGVKDIVKWMPLIGDLAAVSELTFKETAEQMMRVFSAGINAADRFRDTGIKSFLGFIAKTEYSTEESTKKIWEAWTRVGSRFRGASEEMAKTWDGLMSMMSDKWTQIRQEVMDAGIYDALKNVLQSILDMMDAWVIKATDVSGSIQKIADNINVANDFLKEHKEGLMTILKVLGSIAAIWVGGMLIKGVAWVAKLFVSLFVTMKSLKKITTMFMFEWKFGMTSMMNWRGKLNLIKITISGIWKAFKLIRFTIAGLVYLIAEQLIGVVWESYKAVGDMSGMWDITLRKMKSLLEGFRHYYFMAWLYIAKFFQVQINLMIRNWGRFLDFIREHTPQRLQDWLGIPTKGAVTQLMFADRLIEEESKRHLAALKRIRDEYRDTSTGQAALYKNLKTPTVGGSIKGTYAELGIGTGGMYAPEPPGFGGVEKEFDLNKYLSDVDKLIEAERKKSSLIGELYMLDVQWREEAWAKNKTLMEEEKETWRQLMMAKQEAFAVTNWTQHDIALQQSQEEVKRYLEELEKMDELYRSIGQNITSTFVDGFADAMLGVKSFQEAFSQMAASLAADLMRIALKMMFLASIKKMFGDSAEGSIGNLIFKAFGSPRASGGPVSGGTPYIVGERGPELFVPGQSGGIVPNNKMGGGGDVNINVQVQAQPGTSDEDAKRQGMAAARAFNNQIDQRILKSVRAGGLLYSGGR